jgi:hypothetical protein
MVPPTARSPFPLSTLVRPARHVANASLYGVIDAKPPDPTNLVAPLHPNMFNNNPA